MARQMWEHKTSLFIEMSRYIQSQKTSAQKDGYKQMMRRKQPSFRSQLGRENA